MWDAPVSRSEASPTTDLPDSRLLSRLRDALDEGRLTEAELRAVIEEADGWARSLRAQVEASERRLERLGADPESSLTELAQELRRVELLLPALREARTLLTRLEERARQVRTMRLLQQAVTVRPFAAAAAARD
jgi:predicted RNase H-like nuclease (RuvC/YqgF family)